MSSDFESPLRLSTWMTPTVKGAVICFGCIAVGAYMLSTLNETASPVVKANGQSEQNGVAAVPAGAETASPELHSELAQARDETRQLADQVARLEASLNQAGGIEAREALARSEHAVNKVKFAEVSALCDAATRDLGKIRKLQADWAVIEDSMMTGESGRRVAGSPQHVSQVVEILQRERPDPERVARWDSRLNVLAEPITEAASQATTFSITEEHAQLLSDLGKELKTQAVEFEDQKLLMESIQRETAVLPIGSTTLTAALKHYQVEQNEAERRRLDQVRATARIAAEKMQAEQIAEREQQLAEEKVKLDLERIASEGKIQAEEARVAEQQRQSKMADLKETSKRIQEAATEAQLEAQMERDMNEIKGLLAAFISPGFKHRNDDKRGPASLTVIQNKDALESTNKGMTALLWLGCADNDRPHQALPYYIGGNLQWDDTNTKPVERAQELLKKYGALMVKKGLLAE